MLKAEIYNKICEKYPSLWAFPLDWKAGLYSNSVRKDQLLRIAKELNVKLE